MTEVGAPPNASNEEQASYLSELLPHMREVGVSEVFWFQLIDGFGGTKHAEHGVLDEKLVPKPAFYALAEVTGCGARQR